MMPLPEDLPHNFEMEQGLLGALLSDNGVYSGVQELLEPHHFADPMHGELYQAIARLLDRGQLVSGVTLRAYVEASPALQDNGGLGYIAKLVGAAAFAMEAVEYARAIRDLWLRRSVIQRAARMMAEARNPEATAMEHVEQLERDLYDLASEGQEEAGFRPLSHGMAEALGYAERAFRRGGQVAGLSTGLKDLDRLLGGLHPSDLVIIAGRPSMGKTALALNIAASVAGAYAVGEDGAVVDGGVVGVFSLEMSADQLSGRLLAERAQVPANKLRTASELKQADMDRLIDGAYALEALPLHVDDGAALTIQALRTRARRLKRKQGLHLLIVDYLQLITPARRNDGRVNEVSEISRGLKTLAKELNVPVVALSQLSRGVESRDDKRPQLADLRESGSIEQDADVVLFVFREEYYKAREEPLRKADESDAKYASRVEKWQGELAACAGRAELIVSKQRHGPTGTVKCRFDGLYTRFSDYPEATYSGELL